VCIRLTFWLEEAITYVIRVRCADKVEYLHDAVTFIFEATYHNQEKGQTQYAETAQIAMLRNFLLTEQSEPFRHSLDSDAEKSCFDRTFLPANPGSASRSLQLGNTIFIKRWHVVNFETREVAHLLLCQSTKNQQEEDLVRRCLLEMPTQMNARNFLMQLSHAIRNDERRFSYVLHPASIFVQPSPSGDGINVIDIDAVAFLQTSADERGVASQTETHQMSADSGLIVVDQTIESDVASYADHKTLKHAMGEKETHATAAAKHQSVENEPFDGRFCSLWMDEEDEEDEDPPSPPHLSSELDVD